MPAYQILTFDFGISVVDRIIIIAQNRFNRIYLIRFALSVWPSGRTLSASWNGGDCCAFFWTFFLNICSGLPYSKIAWVRFGVVLLPVDILFQLLIVQVWLLCSGFSCNI